MTDFELNQTLVLSVINSNSQLCIILLGYTFRLRDNKLREDIIEDTMGDSMAAASANEKRERRSSIDTAVSLAEAERVRRLHTEIGNC